MLPKRSALRVHYNRRKAIYLLTVPLELIRELHRPDAIQLFDVVIPKSWSI